MLRILNFIIVPITKDFGAAIAGDPNFHVPGVMYHEPGKVRFRCPCGCDRVFSLPVRDGTEHSNETGWVLGSKFVMNEKGIGSHVPTLSPSVYDKTPGGCNSHFFIIDGSVQWC